MITVRELKSLLRNASDDDGIYVNGLPLLTFNRCYFHRNSGNFFDTEVYNCHRAIYLGDMVPAVAPIIPGSNYRAMSGAMYEQSGGTINWDDRTRDPNIRLNPEPLVVSRRDEDEDFDEDDEDREYDPDEDEPTDEEVDAAENEQREIDIANQPSESIINYPRVVLYTEPQVPSLSDMINRYARGIEESPPVMLPLDPPSTMNLNVEGLRRVIEDLTINPIQPPVRNVEEPPVIQPTMWTTYRPTIVDIVDELVVNHEETIIGPLDESLVTTALEAHESVQGDNRPLYYSAADTLTNLLSEAPTSPVEEPVALAPVRAPRGTRAPRTRASANGRRVPRGLTE